METKLTDFEIMGYMSREDMDIRMSPNFVETKTTKQGGVVTMGVDEQTVLDIFNDKIQPVLYCVNKKIFFGIKSGELSAPSKYNDLIEAAEDFLNKVDNGKAKSVDSYNKFKAALSKL